LLTNEVPERPEVAQADLRTSRRSRLRKVAVVLAIVLAGFCVASGRLFIWPAQGMPARVDAIVVLGGPGDRLGQGLELANQGRAPVLVVSRGLPNDQILDRVCGQHDRAFRLICFLPQPGTTQGEAEFVGRLAKQEHWQSVALVTTPDQDTRARIRFGRCYSGNLYVVTTPLAISKWPYEIAYQWTAMFRATVLQRSC
jgi:uncharacterized SAM-binding protein YcdF (DUF218 family)